MTIHIHTKHYQESGLCMIDYFMALLYEQREDWTAKELKKILNVTERTAVRMRMRLVHLGYLKLVDTGDWKNKKAWTYTLTDKLYPLKKKKNATI